MTSPGSMGSITTMWSGDPAPSLCRWRTTGSSPRRSGRSCFPRSSRSPADLTALRPDAVGPQRLNSVEPPRRVHRRRGAGGENLAFVPTLELGRRLVLSLLVGDVGAVAGGARQYRRARRPAVGGRP